MVETQDVKDVVETKQNARFYSLLASVGIVEMRTKILIAALLFVVFFSSTVSFLLMPPFNFPNDKIINIKNGDSLRTVSALLKDANIIRSPYYFEFCAKVVGGAKPIVAGGYFFKEPISACRVAIRIARGISGIPEVKITIPEGMSNIQIAATLVKNIPKFNSAFFVEDAVAEEGFLFPDTYFFPGNVKPQVVVYAMIDNFNKKIKVLNSEISGSGHSLREIVIMASILEKEATNEEDKAIVSGILWKRISIGMPLQVDASFLYLLGKKSSEVTVSDMQIKSGYNTYTNKGLPTGPIGNPGLIAIKAALHPTLSEYLYYLSDDDGVMHYAKTFEGHKANKLKYLK